MDPAWGRVCWAGIYLRSGSNLLCGKWWFLVTTTCRDWYLMALAECASDLRSMVLEWIGVLWALVFFIVFSEDVFGKSRLVGGFCWRFGKIKSWEVWWFGWPWEGGLGGDFLGVRLGWIFLMTWDVLWLGMAMSQSWGSKIVKTLPASNSVGILKHWNLNFYLSA